MKLCLVIIVLLFFTNLMATDTEDVVTEVLAKTTQSWDKNDLPNYPQGKPEITILKITVQPGVKLPLHYHPVINAGVILKGELTVITEDNEKLMLKQGEAIVEVVNKWHYGINKGTEPVEIIVFYAGEVDKDITVKKKNH